MPFNHLQARDGYHCPAARESEKPGCTKFHFSQIVARVAFISFSIMLFGTVIPHLAHNS